MANNNTKKPSSYDVEKGLFVLVTPNCINNIQRSRSKQYYPLWLTNEYVYRQKNESG